MTTTVVNKHWQGYDVYIGRGSPFGNPFVIGRDGDRDEVVEKYRGWVVNQSQIMRRLPDLRGKRLGCFCAPKRCHGDVLAELADSAAGRRVVVRKRARRPED